MAWSGGAEMRQSIGPSRPRVPSARVGAAGSFVYSAVVSAGHSPADYTPG